MNEVAWSDSVWFSPCYVISELEREISLGTKVFDRSLKRHREAWIAAVAVICYAKDNPAEWWLQVPKTDPPDVLGMNLIPSGSGSGQDMSVTQFEVFEINPNDKRSALRIIKEKISGVDYSGMVLVAYIRKEGFYDFRDLCAQLKLIKPDIVSLCVLVFQQGLGRCSFYQLYPELGLIEEDYRSHCATSEQRHFVHMSRSTRLERSDWETNERPRLIPDN